MKPKQLNRWTRQAGLAAVTLTTALVFAVGAEANPDLLTQARDAINAGRSEEALSQLNQMETPANANSYHRLRGRAYHNLGRTPEAIVEYQKALAVNPKDAWSMNNLGLIYLQLGQHENALPPLARAIEIRTDEAVMHNNLGVALERSGYLLEARDCYANAAAVDPTHPTAAANLVRVEARTPEAGAEPADLAGLADQFEAEISDWQAPESASSGETEPQDSEDTAALTDETQDQK